MTSSDGPRVGVQGSGEPGLELHPRDRVERAEGLVEAQDGPAGQQGAGEGDPLAHAARQRARRVSGEAGEPERVEHLTGEPPGVGARATGDAQGERGVVERAQPGQEQVALGHQGGRLGADGAGVGRLEAADELEQRRLAGAAASDDGDDLAGGDVECEPLERDERRPVGPVEPAGDVAHAHGRSAGPGARIERAALARLESRVHQAAYRSRTPPTAKRPVSRGAERSAP